MIGEKSDAEMRDIVLDTLARDGRVEMEELHIDCRDGVMSRTGSFPLKAAVKSCGRSFPISWDSPGLWKMSESTASPGNAGREIPVKHARNSGKGDFDGG